MMLTYAQIIEVAFSKHSQVPQPFQIKLERKEIHELDFIFNFQITYS